MCALRPEHAPFLISYIVSPLCRLHTLKANANSIGLRAVHDLVAGIERANFSLLSLDLYMNGCADDDLPEDIEAKEDTTKLLKNLLTRNMLLKHTTEADALSLLHHSRLLLLQSRTSDTSNPSDAPLTFSSLPTEIKLYTLSFLAPTLSSPQRIRIYTYASDPATLPKLLPSLSRLCLPDPTNLHFASSLGRSPGYCIGSSNSILCNRGQERKTWLALVGCDRYEPEPVIYKADEKVV